MVYIITAVWILIELCSHYIFLDAFMPCRRTRSQCMISVLILWIILYGYSAYLLTGIIKQILTISLIIIWSLYTFAGSWQRHILISILSCIFCGVIDIAVTYGVSALLSISYTELAWRKLLYTIAGSIAKLLFLLLSYLIHRIRMPYGSQTIHSKWTLLTLLFPAASIMMLAIVFNSYQDNDDLSISAFVSSCVLAVANIAILYLISAMEKSTEKEKELVLLNQQMEIHTKNILALEKSYRTQRHATHEFNHQLQTIQNLLSDNATEAAQEYVQQLQGTHTLRTTNVNSHHPIIDAILNQKYQEAHEQSIEIQLQINDLSSITLKPDALVVLLSNLFDNAIEACMRLPSDRMIHCSILANDNLFISIRNTSMPVTIINGSIETSKESKEDHGYGLISIQHILNMLAAEYTFEYTSGWFCFAAEIPHATTKNPCSHNQSV